jgi:uncharacterized protein (TIGR02466 family)
MAVQSLFPTLVAVERLRKRDLKRFNRTLLDEIDSLRLADSAGLAWSRKNYVGGYTSYGSYDRLQATSSTFAALQRAIDPLVRRFADALEYDMRGRALKMTDCWVNAMTGAVSHGLHLHPLSFVSGTYYAQIPRSAAPIKFEDPRLSKLMAAPPRRAEGSRAAQPFVEISPQVGQVVLFESWLRHEVPASATMRGERISVSFNYAWSEER